MKYKLFSLFILFSLLASLSSASPVLAQSTVLPAPSTAFIARIPNNWVDAAGWLAATDITHSDIAPNPVFKVSANMDSVDSYEWPLGRYGGPQDQQPCHAAESRLHRIANCTTCRLGS